MRDGWTVGGGEAALSRPQCQRSGPCQRATDGRDARRPRELRWCSRGGGRGRGAVDCSATVAVGSAGGRLVFVASTRLWRAAASSTPKDTSRVCASRSHQPPSAGRCSRRFEARNICAATAPSTLHGLTTRREPPVLPQTASRTSSFNEARLPATDRSHLTAGRCSKLLCGIRRRAANPIAVDRPATSSPVTLNADCRCGSARRQTTEQLAGRATERWRRIGWSLKWVTERRLPTVARRRRRRRQRRFSWRN